MAAYPSHEEAPLVSIVTPNFNGRRNLPAARESLLKQKVSDWEWLVVDDNSTDGSGALLEVWAAEDPRVRLLTTTSNAGAGPARNLGTAYSRGRYIAFLDADDVWSESKLAEQLDFMSRTKTSFCYTGFRYMPEAGGTEGAVASVPRSLHYSDALKNTAILTSTVMLDTRSVPRGDVTFPAIRRGQDTALWWRLLRKHGPALGLQKPLTGYRQNPGSLSAPRITAIRRTWYLYRNVEGLSRTRSAWCFGHYVVNAVLRRHGRVRVTGQ